MSDAHKMAALSNLFGALCIGVGDLQNAAMARAAGIDPTMLATLLFIHTRPACAIGDVAKTACVTHSGAVRAVDRLVSLGLAKRRLDSDDRRIAALYCTPVGSAIAERALAARRAALGNLLANALGSKVDRVTAKDIIERLLACLRPETRADAWRICRLCEHAVCRGKDCPVGKSVA
jgi:DNA-binding MarR family transcriptional regulator